jgi:transposase
MPPHSREPQPRLRAWQGSGRATGSTTELLPVREWVEAQKAQGVEFVLEFLPAYSPNLNPIERLWKFLRKHALPQRHPS